MAKSKNLVRFKNLDFFLNFKNIKIGLGFLIFKARLALTKLKQIFINALTLIISIQNAIFGLNLIYLGMQ